MFSKTGRRPHRAKKRKRRQILTERLEARTLLAGVTPDWSASSGDVVDLKFDVDANYKGDVYIRTDNAGAVEWSTDGTTYQTVGVTFQGKRAAKVYMSNDPGAEFASNFASDKFNKLIIGDFAVPGVDVTFSGLKIDVSAGASINTSVVDGKSGNLTFTSPLLTTNTGSSIITDNVLDTDMPGNLTVNAQANLSVLSSFFGSSLPFLPSVSNTDADVNLFGTVIRTGNFSIDADADSADLYDDEDPNKRSNFGKKTAEGLSEFIGSVSLFAGFAISRGTSRVTISGGSINSANLTVTSSAKSEANVFAVSPLYGAAGLGISEPDARITVSGGATINSTGNVSLKTDADAALSVTSRLRGKNFGASVSLGFVDIESIAVVSPTSSITATGSVDVTADARKSQTILASTSGFKEAKATFAVGYSQSIVDVTAAVDGSVAADGNVNIKSNLVSRINTLNSSSTTGVGSLLGLGLDQVKSVSKLKGIQGLVKLVSGGVKNPSFTSSALAGGFSVGYQINNVEARVGANALVESTAGAVDVTSNIVEFPKSAAQSYVANRVGGLSNTKQIVDVRDNSGSFAVMVGVFDNNAKAVVANGATVRAGKDLNVAATTNIPNEQLWSRHFNRGFSDRGPGQSISAKLNYNFGVQDGLFTSWAEAFTEAKRFAVGIQANVTFIGNSAEATIGNGATVVTGGDTSVVSSVENDTLNFAGQFAWFLLGSGAATSGNRATGIGAAVMAIVFNNESIAEIQSGANVTSESLLVMAESDSTTMGLVTQGGKSDGLSLNGAVSALAVDSRTTARIDDGATITTRSGLVEVPRDFDEFDTSTNGLFSSVTYFSPKEPVSEDGQTLRVNVDSEIIELGYQHGLSDGDSVRYLTGGGRPIGGLTGNQTYYVKKKSDSGLRLSATPNGPAIDLDLTNTTGDAHALIQGFAPSVVDATDKTLIDLGRSHELEKGQTVVYYGNSGPAISPLVSGSVYFVTKVDATKLRLATTSGGSPITLNPAQASGNGHFFIPIAPGTVNEVAPGRNPKTIRLENFLEALDSNNDGKVTTADKYVHDINQSVYRTNLSLLVLADDNSDLINAVGGFSFGRSVGVGGSLAVNTIKRETEALIGNLTVDLGSDSVSAPGVGIDSQDRVYLGYNHGFSDGDQVTYAGGGDVGIDGLRDGEKYFVNIGQNADSNDSGDPVFTLSRTAAERTAQFDDTNVDTNKDVIELGYNHGFHLGDPVKYSNGTSAAIGGLVDGQTYYAIPVSSTAIALTEFSDERLLTYQTIFDPFTTVEANQIVFDFDHGFNDKEALRYTAGGGTAVGGLTDGATYYAHVVNSQTIELRATSTSPTSITLGSTENVGSTHTLQRGLIHAANLITGVNPTGPSHTVNLGHWHGFQTGTPIRYSTSGTVINGLTNDTVYYAIVDGEQTIALGASQDAAIKGQWEFFDSAISIQSSNNGSIFELSNENSYALGDAIVYSRNAFYTASGADPTT
ncbi:MAG: hypothetical protein MI861_07845, partial [Pirellulales bacterium]|nr:hypothetical protein [Pirellulales bacterium]